MIIPGEIVSELFPFGEIKEDSVDRILHGQPIYNENLTKNIKLSSEQNICIFSKGKFVGIFKVINQARVFAKPEFVFQPIK